MQKVLCSAKILLLAHVWRLALQQLKPQNHYFSVCFNRRRRRRRQQRAGLASSFSATTMTMTVKAMASSTNPIATFDSWRCLVGQDFQCAEENTLRLEIVGLQRNLYFSTKLRCLLSGFRPLSSSGESLFLYEYLLQSFPKLGRRMSWGLHSSTCFINAEIRHGVQPNILVTKVKRMENTTSLLFTVNAWRMFQTLTAWMR